MKKRTGIAVMLAAFCVAALVPATPLRAEDEDLDSTVYMVFDPETGELIIVEEPSGVRRQHDPRDATSTNAETNSVAASNDSMSITMLLGGAVVLGMLGGIVVWIRKNNQAS